MFQHLFAEMNEMLQEIIIHYPTAQGARREELLCKYNLLRRLSDNVMDEWLAFAEKMNVFSQGTDLSLGIEEEPAVQEAPELSMESFVRGQGYYKLLMYPQCIEQFKSVISRYPDSLAGRLYLAMSYLHQGEGEAAWEHLDHMMSLIRSRKLKAMVYNAMGCIRALQERFTEAQELFSLSLQHDPSLPEPNVNLEVCRRKGGELQYGSQLVSLL
jgi:tetratricopeptide (TPR) repeat protein